MKHVKLYENFDETFNSKVDMKKLEQKLKRLKAANPGKRVSYTFSDQGSGGVVYMIDGKMIKEGLNEQLFIVMNQTDGTPASPEVMSDADADKFIQEFPKRFKAQGYYLTNRRERIDPLDVRLEKVPVDDEDIYGEYEAIENITMRGFIGNFKIKRGETITIDAGKLPKNYKVRLPNRGITEIATSVIQDLVAAGRLEWTGDLDEHIRAGDDFPIGKTVELTDEQITELKALMADYVEKHGEPFKREYKNVNATTGSYFGEYYKITPEWEAFLKKVGVTQDMDFGFDEKAYRDTYQVRFKSKYPGKGPDTYGYVENMAIG